jgi:hypothetical protein
MKRVVYKRREGIYALPCTGSNSTAFSGVHVSNSDSVRLNIDIDLLDADGDDALDFFFFDVVPASVEISSSSSSSSSSPPLSADRVTPATGFS